MGTKLRPEHRLLCACAGAPLTPERRKGIEKLLRDPLDWALVLETARAQRIVALCYPALQELGYGRVPGDVMTSIRGGAVAVGGRNLHAAARLLEIAGRAEAEKIALVPYKGPVLAEMAYGNLGLREFVDLDFIVPHRDLRAAWNLLEELGYRPVKLTLTAPETPVRDEYLFLSSGSDIQVEVRTELTLRHFPSPPDLAPLLAGRKPVSIAGGRVLTFSREDTLTLLAVHGAKDFWAELLWVCDIARLIETPGFDWRRALACADRMGCRRMTNVALLLARDTLGAAMPESVLAAATADRGARAQASWLARRLFAFAPLSRREQIRYRMRMVEGFWPGVRYVARLGTTPATDDWNAMRLPGALRYGYAVLRPLRLLRRRSS